MSWKQLCRSCRKVRLIDQRNSFIDNMLVELNRESSQIKVCIAIFCGTPWKPLYSNCTRELITEGNQTPSYSMGMVSLWLFEHEPIIWVSDAKSFGISLSVATWK